ncbi:MAG: TSUP family transporter [Burkholderiales bacterium]
MIATYFQHHYLFLLTFLLIMGFLAGFIDAIAGGGGLVSIPALAYTGMPITLVLGTNKFQSSWGTGVAVYRYYKDGLINFITVYRGLIMGFLGALIGAVMVNYVSNQFMQFIVPFLMLFVFLFNLINKSLGVHPGQKRLSEAVFFSFFGFLFGFYDAFFGPGVGNFWIIAIVFFLGYTFLNASAYAKVLNLKSNLLSLAVFLYYGKVNFVFGMVMAVGQFLGGYLGARAVIVKGSKFVRPFFLGVVFINVLMLFYQMIFSQHNNVNLD